MKSFIYISTTQRLLGFQRRALWEYYVSEGNSAVQGPFWFRPHPLSWHNLATARKSYLLGGSSAANNYFCFGLSVEQKHLLPSRMVWKKQIHASDIEMVGFLNRIKWRWFPGGIQRFRYHQVIQQRASVITTSLLSLFLGINEVWTRYTLDKKDKKPCSSHISPYRKKKSEHLERKIVFFEIREWRWNIHISSRNIWWSEDKVNQMKWILHVWGCMSSQKKRGCFCFWFD